jgi:hypothetical protein
MAKKIARPYTLESLAELQVEEVKQLLVELDAQAVVLLDRATQAEERITVLETDLTVAKTDLDAANKKLDHIAVNGFMTEEQETEVTALVKRVQILEKENAALQAKAAAPANAEPKKITLPTQPFKAIRKGETEEQEYVFAVAKFRFQAQDITAEDALTDPDLLQKLVDCQSGVIRLK